MYDYNYHRDRRTHAERALPPVYVDDDGIEHQLPWEWAVCDLCNGKGSYVNPAIDCDGLTRDDFDEDPDFAENYFSGMYDVTCRKCVGRTTIPVPDEFRCPPDLLKAYREQQHRVAEMEAEWRNELATGV